MLKVDGVSDVLLQVTTARIVQQAKSVMLMDVKAMGTVATCKILGSFMAGKPWYFHLSSSTSILFWIANKEKRASCYCEIIWPIAVLVTFYHPSQNLATKDLGSWLGVGWSFTWRSLCRVECLDKWAKDLSCFGIPRPLRLPIPTHSWLHTLSDASKDAYAAVTNLVCKNGINPPTSRLIVSKSRVSPLKSVIISRLEVMGALLACHLTKNILETLKVDGTTYWTDSTNVLYWIHNQSRIFKPLVANRILEIQRNTNPDQ